MPKIMSNEPDAIVHEIAEALKQYEKEHPTGRATLYRYSSASVRIRVVDQRFSGLSKAARGSLVWPYLRSLPDEVRDDISMLLLMTPEEAKRSLANQDFDQKHPTSF